MVKASEDLKISKKFKEKRKELKLSQEEVAKSIGVDQKTISHWENGINEPQLKKLRIFCNNYNIPLSFFIDKSFIREGVDSYNLNYYDSFESLEKSEFKLVNISKLFFNKDITENSFIVKTQEGSFDGKLNEDIFLLIEPCESVIFSKNISYLFKYQNDFYIRYISKNINSVIISAENKNFPPVILNEDEFLNIKIFGYVLGKIQIKID